MTNSNAQLMYPPAQPTATVSQSTSSCSDRDTSFPFLIWLMPSMAATAENAQQEPARAATQNLIRTGFNPHPSFHGSLFFADAAITALTTLPLVLHRRHSPFLPPVDAFR